MLMGRAALLAENDCGKAVTLGDVVIVAYNDKGHIRGIFCSEQCQRQHIIKVLARQQAARRKKRVKKQKIV